MMLEHLGEPDAARLVMSAIEVVALDGPRTIDIGGEAGTAEVGTAVARRILEA